MFVKRLILITGGAGFIGSHLCDELLRHGYRVRALDSLLPQVHGPGARRPDYLDPEVELLVGDVRVPATLCRALKGVDAVFHLAASVGVGQSMYEIAPYTSANCVGTASLLQALIDKPVERLIVASSMSIYGEGLYRGSNGSQANGASRSLKDLQQGVWEISGADGAPLTPLPTPETKPPVLSSVYALSKYYQEQICLQVGQAYQIPTVALRFFNVFGRRQALSNPYTGVLAIFASRCLNNQPPLIYEDGRQRRDFIHVADIARACRLALEAPEAPNQVFNVGSGRQYTILEIAHQVCRALGRGSLQPEITGKYRVGDIRHCFADITRARTHLKFEPQVDFEPGLAELADWLAGKTAADRLAQANRELAVRGLTL
jgi:dTDP-L-rhamnose 4-epimerase